jgi:UDP-hydrolysing UDP-N-acetyl-D-glucosamine 2-epimerase
MSNRRRICVVTGSRADYGLLCGLLREISRDSALELQLVVTGSHLAPQLGLTYRQIEADGYTISDRVDMRLDIDTSAGITRSTGLAVMGFGDVFERNKPDLLVLLGDRYEILAAAQAALLARVPIAHIHGGEVSEGAFDESIRHAVTKMAHWHFVAAEPYRKRVVQLGEPPETVFCFGAPGLDLLNELKWMGRPDLESDFGIALNPPLFLITYHPVTLSDASPAVVMHEILAALEDFPCGSMIFTYPNADTGGKALIDCIDDFVARHPTCARARASLGQRRYLSLMRHADVILGNSSSGLIEAPALGRATVNIGDRQKGRLKATSVIDTGEARAEIAAGIAAALAPEFRSRLPETVSLYGHGNVSARIKDTLKEAALDVRKKFFNIAHDY